MTNFEKIKQMSLEEMATAIDDNSYDVEPCNCCVFVASSCLYTDCTVGIKIWLESEVEE